MMNITIFVTTLIASISSTIFYTTPEKTNSPVPQKKQEKKIEYVTRNSDFRQLEITAFHNKNFFLNYKINTKRS